MDITDQICALGKLMYLRHGVDLGEMVGSSCISFWSVCWAGHCGQDERDPQGLPGLTHS